MNVTLRLTLATLCYFSASVAYATNLLVGGDFEPLTGQVPGWTLQEHITGDPIAFLDTADLEPWGFNDPLEPNVLWLKSFSGGSDPGPNNLTTATLSQTVPATGGETYSFKADSRWEDRYSGGVTTLADGFDCTWMQCGPMPGQASPTSTTLEMVFLDAVGSPIGAPVILDLRNEQLNFNSTVTHDLSAVAPLGTTQVRVAARADAMVYNADPYQSAFFEDFSLTASSNPLSEILANAGLEETPASGLDPWTIVIDDPEQFDPSSEVVRIADFGTNSNHTIVGEQGLYLSPWIGEPGTPVDGSVSQIVAALPGRTYEFSAWSRIEANYLAGLTFMELAFLDGSASVIGSPVLLDLAAAGQLQDGMWREFLLSAIAPLGTANLKVSVGMVDGVFNTNPGQSAFFDDLSLVQTVPEPSGMLLFMTGGVACMIRRSYGLRPRNL